ncbi:MAG: hypothetical protein QT11_C0001G1002 [archaeon GW2011_AR20]|nr:MAG: hypothetical protein QT11_C0001G1002 [archaeon GW2011_AR20]AQS33440.1 hypothetical protein [uncultured archaeon]AQS33496.1 hypothetical protein [uncultured archaeon]MBS3161028.1 hypothetical protein [Candidatus Woesearchaeota archaeon]
MKYNIDLKEKYPCIVKANKHYVTVIKLEHAPNEDILYLENKDIIHLNSDGYAHSRLIDFSKEELRHIVKKYRGNPEINLNDLVELKTLENILVNIKK